MTEYLLTVSTPPACSANITCTGKIRIEHKIFLATERSTTSPLEHAYYENMLVVHTLCLQCASLYLPAPPDICASVPQCFISKANTESMPLHFMTKHWCSTTLSTFSTCLNWSFLGCLLSNSCLVDCWNWWNSASVHLEPSSPEAWPTSGWKRSTEVDWCSVAVWTWVGSHRARKAPTRLTGEQDHITLELLRHSVSSVQV